MRCPLCRNLQLAFEARQREFIESNFLAYYLVSKKFAAYKLVEMERARIEMQDHWSVCTYSVAEPERSIRIPEAGLSRKEAHRNSPLETAA